MKRSLLRSLFCSGLMLCSCAKEVETQIPVPENLQVLEGKILEEMGSANQKSENPNFKYLKLDYGIVFESQGRYYHLEIRSADEKEILKLAGELKAGNRINIQIDGKRSFVGPYNDSYIGIVDARDIKKL